MIKKILLGCAMTAALAGCVNFPTEKASVVDNRPQLSFRTQQDGDAMQVFVDGIANGAVSQYREGRAALRVLPGTHVIEVRRGGGVVHTERVYVGDGVTKTIILP